MSFDVDANRDLTAKMLFVQNDRDMVIVNNTSIKRTALHFTLTYFISKHFQLKLLSGHFIIKW